MSSKAGGMARSFSVQELTDGALSLPVRFRQPLGAPSSLDAPVLQGELLSTEICPGLTATGHKITFLEDRIVDIDIGPTLTCGVLLDGETHPMLVPGHAPVAQKRHAPALFGFGPSGGQCTAHWRCGQRCTMAGFVVRPEFFDRFAEGVTEDGFEALRKFFDGDHRAVSLTRSPALARTAALNLRNPFEGALGALFLESNTLSLLIGVANLANADDRRETRLSPRHRRLLDAACERLDLDLATPPTTIELARAVGTNVTTLQRLFRRALGVTIFGYVQSRRLEVARILLLERAGMVSEIARRVGFSSAPAFAAAYRRRFGRSPSEET